MPTRLVFRCMACGAAADPPSREALERRLREPAFGEYVEAGRSRWLIWTGGGPLGPRLYACGDHRGELTAYVRGHYGTLAPNPWKRPPYPHSVWSADTDRALRNGALSALPKWGRG